MKRAQRKANFKKIREAAEDDEQNFERRCTRSSNSATTTATAGLLDGEKIAETSKEPKTDTKSPFAKRANLTRFLYKNKCNIPAEVCKPKENDSSDDFETPVKKTKLAPKLSQQCSSSQSAAANVAGAAKSKAKPKPKATRKRSKQPKIKSALLKTEKMFSEIAAQHCIADHFSPDDIQMALMISRSEVEINGNVQCNRAGVDVDVEIDEAQTRCDSERRRRRQPSDNIDDEDIHAKLQQYGFRTAARGDYANCLAAAFATTAGQRRGKTKWANKFTALTLRNPDVQDKKLKAKIEAMLAQQAAAMQVTTKSLTKSNDAATSAYKIRSNFLLKHCASFSNLRFLERMESTLMTNVEDLSKFFIEELFPVSHLPAGHLLKDWSAIPGREESPSPSPSPSPSTSQRQMRRSRRNLLTEQEQKFEQFYKELDEGNSECMPLATAVEPLNELDGLLEVIAKQNEEIAAPASAPVPAPSLPSSSSVRSANVSLNCMNVSSTLGTETTADTQTRCTSPDLFADSDSDCGGGGKMVEDNPIKNITIYEIFSSDEVKTASNGITMANNELLSVKVENKRDTKFENSGDMPKHASPKDCEHAGDEVQSLKERINDADDNFEPLKVDIDYAGTDIKRLKANIVDAADEMETSMKNSTNDVGNLIFDLTQSDEEHVNNDSDNEVNDCILLSDDEVNYSILKASNYDHQINWKEARRSKSSRSSNQSLAENENLHNFSVLEFVEDEASFANVNLNTNDATICRNGSFDLNFSGDAEPIKAQYLDNAVEDEANDYFSMPHEVLTNNNNEEKEISEADARALLKAQRAEFGILESQSETFSQTPPPVKSFKRGSEKFSSFLYNVEGLNEFDDFDEFDRLIYGSPPTKKSTTTTQEANFDLPTGLSQLLTGEISFNASSVTSVTSVTRNKSPIQQQLHKMKTPPKPVTEEITIDERIYVVQPVKTSKPNFETLSEAEILKQLYDFGIKPLKRKQAIKILEYIYNETHPIITTTTSWSVKNSTGAASKLGAVARTHSQSEISRAQAPQTQKSLKMLNKSQSVPISTQSSSSAKSSLSVNKFNFEDCAGHLLLRYSHELTAELRDGQEFYIFQTNVNKKTQQPLLPLHVAWFNLVCSNRRLHESILTYEPIDLQEISTFFKSLGYRYDPKDLKSFFDRRCIIFRYELTPPDKQQNRHTRKPRINAKHKKKF